ncbi:MAG: hypothetical protein A2882_16285 [Phenylobacterium sp. RIFCSPHIGHO2_01_FULL_70_10]|nr:MAG: hypothetical protein A2882_16285 [Phenylobacterium sp. RIFCSPHIGHO2_01_FULL_70_10]
MVARLTRWAGVLRDYLALLYIPVVTLLAIAMVLLVWRGGWADSTQALRLHYLGAAMVLLVAILGLGLFWLQRQQLDKISVTAGQFSATLDLEAKHEEAAG